MHPPDKLIFEPKTYQTETLKSWQKFIDTGQIDREIIPPHVADSWVRSRAFNVDPWDIPESAYLPEREYKDKVKNEEFLINIAKPFMEEVYNSLEESKYVAVLYNFEGYHLIRLGSFADFERARKYKIKPGLCFDENTLGTTGFSLVKKMDKPLRIIGSQHYHSLLHYIVGSYAPHTAS